MGSGNFTTRAFCDYSTTMNKCVDSRGFVTSGQTYTAHHLNEALNPKNVIRECANSAEHPNTLPIILALDVTGSMGAACQRTAEALCPIMTEVFKLNKGYDIEFMTMGIGDFAYDEAPLQVSQFESDVRIAESLDKIYMEHGGGGNSFESYTAAWLFGLHNTKLDCYDKQHRKGIIITMGDEPLNPYLPYQEVNEKLGSNYQADIETPQLFKEASEKFEIFHISIDDRSSSYSRHAEGIHQSFDKLLGQRSKVSTINNLHNTIVECIDEVISCYSNTSPMLNETSDNASEVSWSH